MVTAAADHGNIFRCNSESRYPKERISLWFVVVAQQCNEVPEGYALFIYPNVR